MLGGLNPSIPSTVRLAPSGIPAEYLDRDLAQGTKRDFAIGLWNAGVVDSLNFAWVAAHGGSPLMASPFTTYLAIDEGDGSYATSVGHVAPMAIMAAFGGLAGAAERAVLAEAETLAAEASPLAGSIRGVNPTAAMENCVACSIATDATLGGSPASAIPGGPFSVVESVTTYRPGAVGIPANGVGGIQTMMTNAGPGARGIVWGTRGTAPGHVFNVVNQGGTIRFLDGQIGGAAAAEGFETYYLFRTH